MNMLAFTLAFAALMGRANGAELAAGQAVHGRHRRVASISGLVFIGRGKRRGMRTYAALAVRDGVVTESRILNGFTVFARAKPSPDLVGRAR